MAQGKQSFENLFPMGLGETEINQREYFWGQCSRIIDSTRIYPHLGGSCKKEDYVFLDNPFQLLNPLM